jgi:UDP-N-acetylglucosamine:LPS N-acetylglucosamine transferase
MHDAAPWLVPEIRRAYTRATLALELPFPGGFDVFPRLRKIPLVARHSTRARAESRAHFGLPANRPVALLSFGGYGVPALDPAGVDCLDEWTVVTTDRIRADTPSASVGERREIVVLPESVFHDTGFRYEDLVAASDVVISKPGYGIIAECIANRAAFLYTSRGTFREYDVLVAGLEGRVRSRFIPQADLLAGRWREALNKLVRLPVPTQSMPTNGAEIAADIISEVVGS